MQYTPNYNLPYYEANDIANYLDTYNNTIIALDKVIHVAQTKAESGELHGEELDKEIKSLTSRVSALETSLASAIENLSALTATVSGHTDEIAKVKEDLLAQNTAVKTLSNNLADLRTRFTGFTTEQENFNNEISARVGNRFFKTHQYNVPSDSSSGQFTTEFTIDTGLSNNDFTKCHTMLEFMQTKADQKQSTAVLNCDFSTTEVQYNLTIDGIRYNVTFNFDSYKSWITIAITGYKQEVAGVLFANAIVYTD